MSKKSLPLHEEESLLGRRCVMASLGSLGALALVACSGATTDVDAGDQDAGDDGAGDAADETTPTCTGIGKLVGTEAQFPVGTWKLVGQLVIAQDANGFFAFSAICTHQGCLVNPPSSNGTTICFCHGSEFDGNGAVLKGPAYTPLPHYALTVCNGSVYVDTSTKVAASTRTPPA